MRANRTHISIIFLFLVSIQCVQAVKSISFGAREGNKHIGKKMPKNENGNCGIVKQISLTSIVDDPRVSDVNFTNTTIAFNIEENRRRRAELANDVSELINISKFFQQSYANGYDAGVDDGFSSVVRPKSVEKKSKIRSNSKSMEAKVKKSSSCITANARGIAGKVPHTKLNNAAGAIKMNNNNAVVTQAPTEQSYQCGVLPPVFDLDHEKLNEYCLDIVEEYFKKNKSTDLSDHNIKPKIKSIECTQQNATSKESKVGPVQQQTKIESNKYASVSARYMNKCTNRKADAQPPQKTVRNSWISARSIAILENANRNGAEVKKHNCIGQETKNARSLGLPKKKVQTQTHNRSLENFHRCHPGIELIPSASVFPRRAVKVCDDEPSAQSVTCRGLSNSYTSYTVNEEDANSARNLDVDFRQQSEITVVTKANNENQSVAVIEEAIKCDDAK